jgi:hypothetical protein
MTLFYQTNSWTSQPPVSDETLSLWKHVAKKKNWRIVQLPNGFYQTEYLDPNKKDSWIDATRRETIEGAEQAIDSSIDHYEKKLAHLHGPQVVKTFK